MTRGFPNGGTQYLEDVLPLEMGRTRGTETSKYPQEEKTTVIPQVVASERGAAQTGSVTAAPGLKDGDVGAAKARGGVWKGPPKSVKAAYPKVFCAHSRILSRAGPEKPCLKPAAPSAKAKYS